MKTRYYVEEKRETKDLQRVANSWNVRDRDYRHVIVERFPSREAARRAARLMELKHAKDRDDKIEQGVGETERQYARYKLKMLQERQ